MVARPSASPQTRYESLQGTVSVVLLEATLVSAVALARTPTRVAILS